MKVLLLEHPRGRSALHFNPVANTPLSSSLMSGYLLSMLRSRGVPAVLFIEESLSYIDQLLTDVARVGQESAAGNYD